MKADKLAAKLETLGPGLWLHIDHAATNDPEIQAFGHPGYEYVAADRSANLEDWTSPKVREVIARRGIKLTNYRELHEAPERKVRPLPPCDLSCADSPSSPPRRAPLGRPGAALLRRRSHDPRDADRRWRRAA